MLTKQVVFQNFTHLKICIMESNFHKAVVDFKKFKTPRPKVTSDRERCAFTTKMTKLVDMLVKSIARIPLPSLFIKFCRESKEKSHFINELSVLQK